MSAIGKTEISYFYPIRKLMVRTIVDSDIEAVRILRNQPYIVETMRYKKPISIEEQRQWWANLNKLENQYCVMMEGSDLAGVVNLKNINLSRGTAEWGLFLEEKYQGAIYGVVAGLTILNFAFNELKLKTVIATVLRGNTKAHAFNTGLGFKLLEQNDEEIVYSVTCEDYAKYSIAYQKILK